MPGLPKNEHEALEFLKSNNIKWVDLQFTDLLGKLQHITIPSNEFDESSFKVGFGKLDGSSIKGFTSIYESDMVLLPIPQTMTLIPWMQGVARVLTKVFWGGGKGRFERDPRGIAEEAEKYQSEQGYVSYFGPELEFFVFDKVEVDASLPQSGTGYKIHSREAPWSKNGGYVIRYKEGYYPASPVDQLMDIRLEIISTLVDYFGFTIEAAHHEVATAGQGEIDFRFSTLADTADKVQVLKYVTKNIASKRGMIATFMPKPFFGDNGSGMHTHFSLWTKDGKNLMYDPNDEYAELSQIGRYIIGGLLEHGRALSAIVAPTTNSYRRLVPGYEAPVYLVWSKSNRSAAIRIPAYYKGMEKAKRLEYRPPDPSSNPYLVFSAILMAGLDGIRRKLDPGDPVDENIYHMSEEKKRSLKIRELPGSLDEALNELESDNEFLKPVFNSSILQAYLDLKKEEAKMMQLYPHPMEIYQYLDS
ncbi:type I glutamate--ammonia ligase [Sulfolobus acidocaldarius]|uniref:Glutamine synthetase n=4 Tax=Sulfolobus acidocaldarius TaxID=2285 RepID=GLNA_SULAC|nr:type I glutamate--ammonia ligase [Sulfolobus acidocaldarius]Q9HH09.2 RecName: Full=Glutamine synthetase; Short=GS; AltName: Full=Glutamate--ammonia ligase; AltName: Full=Glutamine synthetase I alpha; Short=GSI alpha [Sulfolobus acidocaldarius DSM 639]AAY80804.1 glutamine synthetase [Sulfolobus acidocaldarius DSM 639]AGE71403.1 glutamine synthetase, type I [Sulfolobus acidocaldarius N8]AGE73674.1 glutamine synthetase, type I [Sulfolobus acidocaldarius Ron12/I]ALU30354.1 glutamine synthetase 